MCARDLGFAVSFKSLSAYLLAVALVGAALLVSLLAFPVVRPLPSAVFLAAVVIAAWRGGFGPALVATLLAALTVDYFFVAPLRALQFTDEDVARFLTFVAVGLFISWLNESLKRARGVAELKAAEARRELLERTRIEQVLRDSEARARLQHEEIDSIYRSAPVGLCALDRALRIVRCNWRFVDMAGAPDDGPTGRPLRDVFPCLVPPADRVATLLSERHPILAYEVTGTTPAAPGITRTWVESWSPLLGAGRDVNGINVVVEDVTASRRIEQELRKASRMKDEFLSTLSHELRTPLNAILGWSHMLLTGVVTGDRGRRALEAIDRAARVQTALVNDALDLSRIVTGKLAMKRRVVDLAPLLANAVETVRLSAEAKQLCISVRDGGWPMITGDADRLQQVFWNLLSNAVKFTPAGGQVSVAFERADAAVEVRVADTGIGIPRDFLPFVFDAFTQADGSTAREHGGLGLGLSIVKHLVELHGGTVRAESAGPGQGTTFIVRLPLASGATNLPDTGPARAAESPASLAGLRVLVVDDDPDSVELLESLLARHGAAVLTSDSAEAALDVLARHTVDVLISDLGMPHVDGYALIRRVRALPGANALVRAIAVTAYTRPEDRARALAAGYQKHVCKPFVPSDLAEMVATVARLPLPRRDDAHHAGS